ncbi:unnamed protein product [Linum trigynum]|uniref:BOP1 N-terminal domain-containing protein n=1 Tax=Linum trigynum TaxID=586398 RepID=A0AAV2FNW1_9ROSI
MGVSVPPKEADRLKNIVDEDGGSSVEFDSEGEASAGSEVSEVATEEDGGSSGDEDASTSDGSGLVDDEDENEGSEEGADANGSSSDDDEKASASADDGLESGEGSGDSDSERSQVAEESDSSEDEVAPRNTIGDVPLEWYKDEQHIGYDIKGKKITKKERQDKLDSFLASVDDSKNWRKIYDDYNDEDVELTKAEAKMISRLLNGKAPHADFDPYAPYVDWFKWDDAIHPLSNAPEPKRRFIPSKWEAKKVVKYVRAIRKGLIKFEKPKEEPRFYMLWGDDSGAADKTNHLSYIPAPKPKLPGHEESYNPSLEYIPTQEEINSYQLMYEEDRPKFIPKRFTSMRSIPAYEDAVKDSFERCLDLYLCPRVRKKRINIDPESLKPKLPSRKDLKPYPSTCYMEYIGHKGPVVSISTEFSGEWIASGSTDGTVRIWEVESGRCRKVWQFDEAVQYVAWNPMPEFPILAISVGQDAYLLNTGLGNEETQRKVGELLHVEAAKVSDDSNNSICSWSQDDEHGGIRLRHAKTVSSVEWHRKGDYFSTIMPADILFLLLFILAIFQLYAFLLSYLGL